MPDPNLLAMTRRASQKYFTKTDVTGTEAAPIGLNNEYLTAINAANTALKNLLKIGSDDLPHFGDGADAGIYFGEEYRRPMRTTVTFKLLVNGSLGDQHFFIVPDVLNGAVIQDIQEIHKTAGNDAGAVTLGITKDGAGVVGGAGVSLMSGTFDMKGTAATLQTATLTTTTADRTLATGDRLSANFTGALTTLAGVVVTIGLTPGGRGDFAIFAMDANADLIDAETFYVANRPQKVRRIDYVHKTAGTNGSAVNLQVAKETGTTAPGGGTDLLTNNANAGFDCKGAINVVQNGTLITTAATLQLLPGDRLSADFGGTLTALVGVLVVVSFEPVYDGTQDVTFALAKNGNLLDQYVFIADRAYYIVDARYVNATAGTDAGAVNAQATIDRLADAPGAGSDVLSNNSNAGFNAKGTAHTVEVGTFLAEGTRYLRRGDRLSVDFAGTIAVLQGVAITFTLRIA